MRILTSLVVGSAVASLAVAQPVLAGTKAADSLPVLSGVERAAAPMSSDRSERAGLAIPLPFLVLGFAGIITAIVVAVEDNGGPDVSPGT